MTGLTEQQAGAGIVPWYGPFDIQSRSDVSAIGQLRAK
jgi:hypothetical protein